MQKDRERANKNTKREKENLIAAWIEQGVCLVSDTKKAYNNIGRGKEE